MIAINLIRGLTQCPIAGIATLYLLPTDARNKAFSRTENPDKRTAHLTFAIPARSAPAPSVESKALPLEWLLAPKSDTHTEHALAYLIRAEAKESDVWARDDYRQAFITISFAAKGYPEPFVEASYLMYGLHPDKLWPAIQARRAALLGARPDVVQTKKPVRGQGSATPEKEAA